LESLAVARIVARAARAASSPLPRAPTEFASGNARLLAAALVEMRDLPASTRAVRDRVEGVAPWIRAYAMRWRDAPLPTPARAFDWQRVRVGFSPDPEGRAAVLIDATEASTPSAMEGLLSCLQWAAGAPHVRHLAILTTDAPLSALARSVALEGRFEGVRLIACTPGAPLNLDLELAGTISGYSEVRLEPDGRRLEPVFGPATVAHQTAPPVGPADVALVTGGARGIAAECALRLAQTSGCSLILCGRSSPQNEDVVAVLERAEACGSKAVYLQADVRAPKELTAALATARLQLGSPTLLIHAPGVNTPMRLQALTAEVLAETLGPKLDGLRNVLDATGPTLRRIYAFGSIIGCIGLEGEAHYALANAWQSKLLARFAQDRPDCLTLSMDWSVWGGVGMGERLGTLERLAAQGVDALGVDEAVDAFSALVAGGAAGELAVTSRFGPPPFLELAAPAVSPLRFVDRVLVHYPGVEMVSETELWAGRDLYLTDHKVQGEMTLPGVMSLEAMVQVASQLAPDGGPFTSISDVAFESPVTVPEGGALTVRVCALRHEDGSVSACIRTADDGYVARRARATFRLGLPTQAGRAPSARGSDRHAAKSLYGPLFFHQRRFQRLASYSLATSREIAASLAPASSDPWFGATDMPGLLMGDLGARDAALHALQAAVPYRVVVPVSVDLITFHPGGQPVEVCAREIAAEVGEYTFDISLSDAAGVVVECWRGARFRSVGLLDAQSVLDAAPWLAGAHLERLCREALRDQSLVLALGQPAKLSQAQQRAAILHRLDLRDPAKRGDGRPTSPGVSFSRGGRGLGVRSGMRVGCDIEPVSSFLQPGPAPSLVEVAGEATIESGDAWVLGEALRKLGRRPPFRVGPVARGRLPVCARLYAAGEAFALVTEAPSDVGPTLVAVAVAPGERVAAGARADDLELTDGR